MLKQTSETLTVVITIDLSWLGKPTFRIVTKKTGAVSHHPVSAEGMEACGPAGDGLIFKGLTLSMTTITFKKWLTDAGSPFYVYDFLP